MTPMIQRRGMAALIVVTLAVATTGSLAQGADKPLRIVRPVGAGSGVDTIMRAVSPSLSKALGGQAVVLENGIWAPRRRARSTMRSIR